MRDLLEPPKIIGDYEIIGKIGQGGMAEIFRARKTSSQSQFAKEVAIKKILPTLAHNEDFTKQFLDEARIAGSLNHPNIVQITDVGQDSSLYYIVMEFVHGHHLGEIVRQLLEKQQFFPFQTAAYIINEVAKGLSYAHAAVDHQGLPQNIVHRDVSPQNILIGYSGVVKLTDFGIAKATNKLYNTTVGVIKGKFSYLAPELLEGQDPSPGRDLFSLGVVLWEILTGRRLFLGKTDLGTIRQIQACVVPDIREIRSDLPAELVEILMKLLQKEPAYRYQFANEACQDLDYFLSLYPHGGIHATKQFMGSLFEDSNQDEFIGSEENTNADSTSPNGLLAEHGGNINDTMNSQHFDDHSTPSYNPIYQQEQNIILHQEQEKYDLYTKQITGEEDDETIHSLPESREPTTQKEPTYKKKKPSYYILIGVLLFVVVLLGAVAAFFLKEYIQVPTSPVTQKTKQPILTLKLQPPGAKVLINNQLLPQQGAIRNIKTLKADTTYKIVVEAPGYQKQVRMIQMEEGDEQVLPILLVRKKE